MKKNLKQRSVIANKKRRCLKLNKSKGYPMRQDCSTEKNTGKNDSKKSLNVSTPVAKVKIVDKVENITSAVADVKTVDECENLSVPIADVKAVDESLSVGTPVTEVKTDEKSGKKQYVLEIKHFSKKYAGAKNYSASDISLALEAGKVLGLVGSNGAGKSTTIKSVTGILPFTEGEIFVNGYDVKKQPIEAKSSIGYVPDDHSVYDVLTGREYADYMGSLFGVPKARKKDRIEYLAKFFNIEFALDKQIAGYSHGMKQKICLIGSLVHSPKLWILDEPMMGLDPQTMNDVKNCIRSYANSGNAVVFSSHNLDVVEKVCDMVAIIKGGKLVEFFDLKQALTDPSFSLEHLFMQINGVWDE